MKVCLVPDCNNPVFAKGYCTYHQYLRPKKKRKPLKTPLIPIRSDKRVREEEEYRKVCDEIDRELQEVGKFRCFFTNELLPAGIKPSHHHLRGRVGKLLTDKRYIVPVLDEPHMNYHDMPVEKLSRLSWYPGFLKRLRNKEMGEELYQKELNKRDKS